MGRCVNEKKTHRTNLSGVNHIYIANRFQPTPYELHFPRLVFHSHFRLIYHSLFVKLKKKNSATKCLPYTAEKNKSVSWVSPYLANFIQYRAESN